MIKSSKNSSQIFFDIHCHAFNLSHAGLLAFLNRFFLNNALTFKDLLKGNFLKILIGLFPCKKSFCWLKRSIMLLSGLLFLLILGFLINPAILGIEISKLTSIQQLLVRGFLVFVIFLAVFLSILIAYWIKKKGISDKIRNTINLLSLMENDLGRQFLYLELDILSKSPFETTKTLVKDIIKNHGDRNAIDQIKQKWEALQDKRIRIKNLDYNKMVLTPLMMDFNYKDFKGLEGIHYHLPPRKPVIDQTVDLFYGIRDYMERSVFHILEIFPFLAVNTQNYDLGVVEEVEINAAKFRNLKKKICYLKKYKKLAIVKKLNEKEVELLLSLVVNEKDKAIVKKMIQDFEDSGFDRKNCLSKMLHKYFYGYKPDYHYFAERFKSDLHETFNPVDKVKVQEISQYFFAGVKVYPPLGFDPWPVENQQEFEKVNYFYQFCSEKRIPITAHCSDSGFLVIPRADVLTYTSPERWADVLREYADLKLNFAHFGSQPNKNSDDWTRKIVEFILDHNNVYADFSYSGVSRKFYSELFSIISSLPRDKMEKLKDHVLFGSDFMINLIEVESYCEYLNHFFSTPLFTAEEKIRFCSANPGKFLFS